MRFSSCLFIGLAFLSTNAVAQSAPQAVAKNLEISIYNNNLALVKDTREISFSKGINNISFEGVSTRLKPESVLLIGQNINVLEQNYDYDLITPSNILKKSVGQKIKTVRQNPQTGSDMFEDATVLSVQNGTPVLEFTYGIETDYTGSLVFKSIPQGLHQKPTLAAKISSVEAGLKELTLAYLTTDISWKTDYVASVQTEDTLNLTGWVTINNQSGIDYPNTAVNLVAGNVRQVQEPRFARGVMMYKANAVMADMATEAAGVAQEQLSAYELYTLPNRTDIKDNQTKQLALLEKKDVLYQKEGRLYSDLYFETDNTSSFERRHPDLVYILENTKEKNLGLSLPAGTMRFYQTDRSGSLQFIGETNIAQTAEKEKLELTLGQMFHVFANGKISNITTVSESLSKKQSGRCPLYQTIKNYEAEVIITNSGEDSVQIAFKQPLGQNSKIIKENVQGKSENVNTYLWQISLSPKAEQKLLYTVQTTTQENRCN